MTKICVRSGAFETNSSSSHSIVINEDVNKKNAKIYLCKNGILKFKESEMYFGRAFFIVDTPKSKFAYLLADRFGWCGRDEEKGEARKEFEDAFIASVEGCKGLEFAQVGDGWYDTSAGGYRGDVDHGSKGSVSGWLEAKGIDRMDFIWDPKYAIVCDSDETCIWKIYKGSGIYNGAKIKEINIRRYADEKDDED